MGRGCGDRVEGKIYLQVLLSSRGLPLEAFMVDPARPIPADLDLPRRGVAILERIVNGEPSGIWDVWDYVGQGGYEDVQDFVAETKRKGVSRRISEGTDFSKLTPQSRLVLVHAHAILDNAQELYKALAEEMREMTDAHQWFCPCFKEEHDNYPEVSGGTDYTFDMPTCIGTYREVVRGGSEVFDPAVAPRTVEKEVGDITYTARRAPIGFTPKHSEGIFMILPISSIAVIKDPAGGRDVPNVERASKSSLPVSLEDA